MVQEGELGQLLARRWSQAQQAVGLPPGVVLLTWDFGPYPHFNTPRGFAVTFNDHKPHCHIRFARKLSQQTTSRVDGIIRHEIGHVLDMTLPAAKLDGWAAGRGVRLPKTVERRADAIAQAVWGEPIRYDEALVQSTTHGVCPRPVHLGL